MQAQLAEADRLGIDVLWWTDHDWRMSAVGYWTDVAFDSELTESEGVAWTWKRAGDLEAAGMHDFRTAPVTTGADAKATALYLSQDVGDDARTAYSIKAVTEQGTYRTSLSGQRFEVDVYPDAIRGNGYLSFELITSLRPAMSGRDAGTYRLSYRIGGGRGPEKYETQGNLGLIFKQAPLGQWSTLILEPETDISALWPEIDGRDASSFDILVKVKASESAMSAGYFGGLRIRRSGVDANAPLETQASLMEHYREQFPHIAQLPGLEVSLTNPHLGVYGGELSIPIGPDAERGGVLAPDEVEGLVSRLHEQGGLVSYNHPFGTGGGDLSRTAQIERVRAIAAELISENVFGAELLEVGYRQRGGVDLAGHLKVWDACSRAGVFVTGIGVNDNHSGMGWDTAENNFSTWIYASEPTVGPLSHALKAGRAYFGDLSKYNGDINIRSANGTTMGQAELQADHGNHITVTVSDLPAGWFVDLVTLDMVKGSETTMVTSPEDSDYARISLGASEFTGGEAAVTIDSAVEQVHRLEVLDNTRQIVAISNPMWLLREGTDFDIPPERLNQ